MIQYDENKFGEISPIEEQMEKFKDCLDSGVTVRALHVGTESQLEKVKQNVSYKQKVDDLADRLKNLKITSGSS